MQTLKGTVTNLNRSTRISGGGSDMPVTTTNISVFQLFRQSIELRDRSPIIINDGDEVIVAGALSKNGVFKATAYRNITRGVRGGSSGVLAIVISTLFLIISLSICLCSFLPSLLTLLAGDSSSSSPFTWLCILPLSLIPIIVSGMSLYFGIRQRQKWAAVK